MNPAEPPGAVGSSGGPTHPIADGLLTALLLGLSALLLSQLLDYGAGRDQALYAVVSDSLLRGEAPYRDAWDFKPPGIYVVYALARGLAGPGIWAVRAFEALGLASLFWAFALLSRRYIGCARAGVVGATLALLAYVPLEFWHTAQPEGFGAVLLVWAMVCASHPVGETAASGLRRPFFAWLTAAALYSLAALLKPPLGGGILVSFGVVVAMQRARHPERSLLRCARAPAAAFAMGGLLPLAVTLAWLEAVGAGAAMREAIFVFAPRYTALDAASVSFPALISRASFEFAVLAAPYPLLGLLALFALPVLGARERLGSVHVLGVIGATLLGVALQAKFFPYHYAAALPLLGLPAGWGFWKLWIRARRSAWFACGLLMILAAAPLVPLPTIPNIPAFWPRTRERLAAWQRPATRVSTRDHLYTHGDVDAESNRLAAAWIASNTPPGSRLYVWGFEPALYLASGRRPASRYVYNIPQRTDWLRDAARRTLLRELEQQEPAALVIVEDDALPWVTGDERDSREALESFPELDRWITANYRPARRFGDLTILLRNPLRR